MAGQRSQTGRGSDRGPGSPHGRAEKNATWSTGFGVGPISVSAQSGYGTSVHDSFAVKSCHQSAGTDINGPIQSPSVEIHHYY
ncbi:hypothetical protein [Leekyejoonella antrihumi]|uniref:Uncharacterized protein n=1 Tax=Leekyejoonella antrihumi TaxID=1660198 RepID=A0A563DUM0_9MICO|nr:hypothetical protein [Leekyejoonella antrihumi]TWP33945.1 hypothetical protein FGL98_19110 [Leekyejoonella antrihumi]